MRLFAHVACVLTLGCGRLGFDAIVLTDGDGGAPDGPDAGPLVCGAWGPVELVPELSSLSTDFGPSLTSNGARLYLHSDRMGSRDIYSAARTGSVFETPAQVTELNDAAFDSKQAQALLGWQPKVDLAEGFAATLRASRQEGGEAAIAHAYVIVSLLTLLAVDPS
jgi:hypothetical protein